MRQTLIASTMLLALAQPAAAYIGVGAGMITTALGILAAVGLAIFAVVWYPIKRLLRRHSTSDKNKDQ